MKMGNMMTSIVYSFSMFVQLPLLHLVLLPAPSHGWCLNRKGWLNGTLSHPFGTPWRVQVCLLATCLCVFSDVSNLKIIHLIGPKCGLSEHGHAKSSYGASFNCCLHSPRGKPCKQWEYLLYHILIGLRFLPTVYTLYNLHMIVTLTESIFYMLIWQLGEFWLALHKGSINLFNVTLYQLINGALVKGRRTTGRTLSGWVFGYPSNFGCLVPNWGGVMFFCCMWLHVFFFSGLMLLYILYIFPDLYAHMYTYAHIVTAEFLPRLGLASLGVGLEVGRSPISWRLKSRMQRDVFEQWKIRVFCGCMGQREGSTKWSLGFQGFGNPIGTYVTYMCIWIIA